MIMMHRMNCRMISRCFIGKRDKKRQWLLDRNERDFYNPIFDSTRAEMPLFLGIIRSFDIAKM